MLPAAADVIVAALLAEANTAGLSDWKGKIRIRQKAVPTPISNMRSLAGW